MDFTTVIWAVVVLGALAIVFGLILAVAAKVFEAVSYTHLTLPTNREV